VVGIIDQCVDFATHRKVKELTLDFVNLDWEDHDVYFGDYEAPFELPEQVYAYTNLEYLKLYSCSFIETEVHNFHVLKEVSLGWMKVSLTAIKTLLSNCRMLESLSLKRCWSLEKFKLGQAETMTLKVLVIDHCRFEFDVFNVNASNLKIFKYFGWMKFNNIEIDLPEIEEVDLDFAIEDSSDGHGYPLYNLVHNLSIANILTVCSYVLQVYFSLKIILLMNIVLYTYCIIIEVITSPPFMYISKMFYMLRLLPVDLNNFEWKMTCVYNI